MALGVKRKSIVIVNGKEYQSLDDLPPDLRALYDQAIAAGPDREHVQRFVIGGHNFENLAVSDDVRQAIRAMDDPKQTTSPIVIVVAVAGTLILIGLALVQLFY